MERRKQIKIDNNVLTGIYLCNEEDILSSIKKNKYNISLNSNSICYIGKNIIIPRSVVTVIDYINYIIRYFNIEIKDKKRKISSSLKIIGFNNYYLDRIITTLSSSELRLLQIIAMLLSNNEIIIIDEPFQYFDLINRKKIKLLIDKMIEKYNKTVIIITKNIDDIYKYTKDLIIIKNDKILANGKTKDLLTNVNFLNDNKICLPESVSFISLAIKIKKVKIDYNIDVRDIIKDIYKHV